MKKICFCTTIADTLYSFFLGASEYIHNHTDWEIYFICAEDNYYTGFFPEYIHFYPIDIKRGISFDGAKVIRELKKIYIKEKFDLIQYSTPNMALFASVAAKEAGIPIRNYHAMGFRYLGSDGMMRKALKRIEKVTCNNSTHIECVSKSNLELGVKEKLFHKDKATVVWNGSTGGVDLRRFDFENREKWKREIRSDLGYSEDDFVYGFVGRITKDKGINELLTAFMRSNSGAKLLLLGSMENEDNGLDEALIASAHQHPDIIFHKSVTDIERYYAALDVLVLPSYREGFGNVVIEAGAVGTPAIVSDIPGPTDAIERDKTAFTVEPGSADKLEDAMLKIRECDCKAMGCNAAKYVKEHFDSKVLNEKILERKLALFAEAAGGGI